MPADDGIRLEPIAEWLLGAGRRIATPGELLTALCERLVGRGLPLDRESLHISTLHPQVRGSRILWQRDGGLMAEVHYGRDDSTIDEAYRKSPLYAVHQSGRALRRELDGSAAIADYPILADLQSDGMTDYLAVPLLFSSGALQIATWASRRPGGFSDSDIAVIDGLLSALGAVAEAHEQRRMLRTLIETYLGQ